MIDCSRAKNYFIEKARMVKRVGDGICHIKCEDCPLSIANNGKAVLCSEFETLYPEEAISAVQRWSDKHPQRTFLTEFLRIFPNAPITDDGTPVANGVCPYHLGLMSVGACRDNCAECWSRPTPVEESDLIESEKIDIKSNKA